VGARFRSSFYQVGEPVVCDWLVVVFVLEVLPGLFEPIFVQRCQKLSLVWGLGADPMRGTGGQNSVESESAVVCQLRVGSFHSAALVSGVETVVLQHTENPLDKLLVAAPVDLFDSAYLGLLLRAFHSNCRV
jgi:hypothetical protein